MTDATAPDPLDAVIEDSARLLQAHKLSCARRLANGDVVPAGDLIATTTMEIRLHNLRSLRRLNQLTRTSPPPVDAIDELKQQAVAPPAGGGSRKTRRRRRPHQGPQTLRSALLLVLDGRDADEDFAPAELQRLLERDGRLASREAVGASLGRMLRRNEVSSPSPGRYR